MPDPRLRVSAWRRLPCAAFALIGGLLLLTLGCHLGAVAHHRAAPVVLASAAGPGSVVGRPAVDEPAVDRPVSDGPRAAGATDRTHSTTSCHAPATVPGTARNGGRYGPGPAERGLIDADPPVQAVPVPAGDRAAPGADGGPSGGRCRLAVSCRWRI
ncbi:hypothetical protein ABTY53_14555 [Streptomyces noursei]|uniref:hypothetical protein n=1 Tax=Streptomyces noursei TaxID=1971 RepID=UPI003332E2C4